ncbi:hypothetical protein ACN2XU_21520 [Primorskyibacter sp. 2E107]|uniref:hypothetical protein n=1 Tax=Primorskyibacter sp. 2E107 TaxID=3403458 RepID=UPI003AF7F418
MKKISIALAALLFSAASSQATILDYSLDGNFVRWWNGTSSTGVGGAYTGAFGGTFSYDTEAGTISGYDLSMDFRYNSGTVAAIGFDPETGTSPSGTIWGNVATFRWHYNSGSGLIRNRLRLYLDSSVSWGDRILTFARVYGDVDTDTGGRGLVGTSPYNNDTGPATASIAAVANVPVPASLPLFGRGAGADRRAVPQAPRFLTVGDSLIGRPGAAPVVLPLAALNQADRMVSLAIDSSMSRAS